MKMTFENIIGFVPKDLRSVNFKVCTDEHGISEQPVRYMYVKYIYHHGVEERKELVFTTCKIEREVPERIVIGYDGYEESYLRIWDFE